jgi:hypothetical protein
MKQVNIVILNEPKKSEERNKCMEKRINTLDLTETKLKIKGYKM